MDELQLVESFRPSAPTTVAEVLSRALIAPDKDELAQAAAERAAADQRAEQRELTAMLDRAAGSPLAQVSRCQGQVAEARAEVDDLEARLAQAQSRLRRCAESLVGWEAEAEKVMAAAQSRADDPLTAASRRAHAAYVEATRTKIAQMGTPQRERSKKVRGGLAVRSENCQLCIDQGASDEEAFLLHSDPQNPLPVVPPGQAVAAEHRGQGAYRGSVISR